MRDLEDGKLKWLWIQVTNPFQSTANNNHWLARRPPARHVHRRLGRLPGDRAKVSDLILPSAMIFEKWGGYGNSERRTQLWRQQVPAPGDAKTDVWQILEFSKRFKLGEVWGEQPLPGLKAEGFTDGRLPSVLDEARRRWATRPTARCTTCSSRRPEQEVPLARPRREGPRERDRRQLGARVVPGKGALRGVRRVRARARATTSRRSTVPRGRRARPAVAGRGRQGDALALQRDVRPVREEGQRASTSTARR